MAMHQPSARIIGDETNDEPAASGKHRDIAAGRIGELQRTGGLVEDTSAGAEDVEVMAVKMDWVRDLSDVVGCGLDDPE